MATAKRPRTTKPKAKSTTTSRKAEPEVAQITTRTVDIQDTIRMRAYELFQQRGCKHGNDLADWLRAETEVRKRFGMSAA